jgi:hypothetical protein
LGAPNPDCRGKAPTKQLRCDEGTRRRAGPFTSHADTKVLLRPVGGGSYNPPTGLELHASIGSILTGH